MKRKIILAHLLLPLVACQSATSNQNTQDGDNSTNQTQNNENTNNTQEEENSGGGGSSGGGGGGGSSGGGGGGSAPAPRVPTPEENFNNWKNQKGEKVKSLYKDSDSYKKDLNTFYLASRGAWSSGDEVNSYYNNWRTNKGLEALKTLYKTKSDYTTKKKAYLDAGSNAKTSKTDWLANSESTTFYDAWRKTRPDALKNAWKNANNYNSKLSDYVTKWKAAHSNIDDKNKFLNHQDSKTYFDAYIADLTNNDLIDGYKKSTSGASSYATKFNAFMASWQTANPTLDNKIKFFNDDSKSKSYYDEFVRKTQNDQTLKNVYINSPQYKVNLETKVDSFITTYKAANPSINTKIKWADHNDSNSYYTSWVNTIPQGLKTTWATTTSGTNNFVSKLNAYKSSSFDKDSFLNSDYANKYYNVWKATRPNALKSAWEKTTSGANSYTTKLNAFVASWKSANSNLDTKTKFADHADSDSYYNTWKATKPDALINAWEATTSGANSYTTKFNSFITSWKTANSNLDTKTKFADHADSDSYYNTWKATKPSALINAWEATTSGANSYTTKFNAFTTSWKTANSNLDTKIKFADHADSDSYYNTWRKTRPTALKSAWEATTSGANSYTTKFNAFKSGYKTRSGAKDSWLNSNHSNSTYNTWRQSSTRPSSLFSAWLQSDSGNNNASDYAWSILKENDEQLFDDYKDNNRYTSAYATWKTNKNNAKVNKYLTEAKEGKLIWYKLFEKYSIVKYANENHNGIFAKVKKLILDNIFEETDFSYNLPFKYVDNGLPEASTFYIYDEYFGNKKIRQIFELFNEIITELRINSYLSFDAHIAKGVRNSKRSEYQTHWTNIFKDANWGGYDWFPKTLIYLFYFGVEDKQIFDDYINWVKAKAGDRDHETWINSMINNSNDDENFLFMTNLIEDLAIQYQKDQISNNQNETKYKSALDLWSATKANGLLTYKADGQSNTDFNTFADNLSANDYKSDNQYNVDLDAWSSTKSNGLSTYKSDASLDNDYEAYLKDKYENAASYDTDFNAWATKANGLATYKASSKLDSDYEAYLKDKYENAASYDTDFNAWATKVNALSIYKSDAQLDKDYLAYIEAKYKVHSSYNGDLDAWSATKANGLPTYKAAGQSDTDYDLGAKEKYLASLASDTDFKTWGAIKSNGLAAYKASNQSGLDYAAYFDKKYRDDTGGTFTTDFNSWKTTRSETRALYQNSAQLDKDYESFIQSEYEKDASFNTDLAAWLSADKNGLKIYATSSELTDDYASYLENHFLTDESDAIGFISLLNTWSKIKNNGINLYAADDTSDTDYASWNDPQHRTDAKYDNNHLNQLETDLNAWSKTKANGLPTYLASEDIDVDYGTWLLLPKNKSKVDAFLEHPKYIEGLNKFVNDVLTWAKYGTQFVREKWQ